MIYFGKYKDNIKRKNTTNTFFKQYPGINMGGNGFRNDFIVRVKFELRSESRPDLPRF